MELREHLQSALDPAYALERELGGGGMSRVFLANERALDRRVVVKVLPPEIAAEVSAERFRREIATAATLQHPHVVPLLAAAERDGLMYFIMPYVAGESLRARLARQGELPVGDAVRVLREVASALAHAHEHGVMHRDVKPENVLLSGGSAMVTDFGVAKAIDAATRGINRPDGDSGKNLPDSITSLGVALGTPAYMAPEQALADPTVDARADVYAWGVLAYELLTGHTPFAGRSLQATLAAHVTEIPEAVGKLRPSLPPTLAALVMRALEKRPADRPQTAQEIVTALDALSTPGGGTARAASVRSTYSRRTVLAGAVAFTVVAVALVAWRMRGTPTTPPPSSGVKSLAVLPFENATRDSSFEYFADGMSDEVRGQLAGVRGLSVKARATSSQFRGQPIDPRAVGSKLAVGAVLSGVVRHVAGNRMQVTAELDDAATGDALWSQTFDLTLGSAAVVRDSIAGRVLAALRPATGAAATVSDVERNTISPEAYDLFLKGRYAYQQADLPRAATLLSRAVSIAPDFARAQAWLAIVLAQLPIIQAGNADSLFALADAASLRAIALDSTSDDARIARASVLVSQYRLVEAERLLRAITAEHPENVDARVQHGYVLGVVGRPVDALRVNEEALRVDPLNVIASLNRSLDLALLGRSREALEATRRILEIDPRNFGAYADMAVAYMTASQPDSAVAALETAERIEPAWMKTQRSGAAIMYAAAGRPKDVERLRRAVQTDHDNHSPFFDEMMFALADKKYDAAMVAMRRGVARREPMFLTLSLGCDPVIAPLRARPDYAALVRPLGITICPA